MAVTQEVVVGNLTAVDNTQVAFNSIQRSARNTQKAAKQLNGQFRMLRGGAGQLGHQIQDIAVQLSMGTNAMIVFGQQGSQIASLFGPKGAMIGAFAAVAAAIGVVFMRDTKAASDELKTFGDRAIQAAREVGILTDVSRAFLTQIQRGRVNQAATEYQTYKLSLQESQDAALALQGDIKALETGVMTVSQAFKLKGKTVQSLTADLNEQESQTTILAGKVEILKQTHAEEAEALKALLQGANPYQDLVKNAEDATASLLEFIARREKREKAEMDLRQARLKQLHSMNSAEIDALVEKEEREQEIFEQKVTRFDIEMSRRQSLSDNLIANANAELDAIVAAEEKKKQAQMATLNMNQMLISNQMQITQSLMQSMDKQSTAYKALFALQQALAIAQTIVQYEVAIAMTKGQLGIFGIPMEMLLRAQQVASVAIIAGQTIAGFEGGGIIPNGPRAGGLDGRGGRMAIVHPNEKITDMRRGQDSQPVTVNFNIQANDTKGFDELLIQRRATIVNMVNKAINNRGRRSLT